MLVLALESADVTGSVALWDDSRLGDESRRGKTGSGALVALRRQPEGRGQADQLIGLIDAMLKAEGVGYRELGLVAVDHGPGSFTGIRAAVALARALALAADLPVIGISGLEALAHAAGPDGAPPAPLMPTPLMIAKDARRGEVYRQSFDARGRPLGEPGAERPQVVARALEGKAWRLAGSGAGLVLDACQDPALVTVLQDVAANAGHVAACAAARLHAGARPLAGPELQPLYLRAPDARPSKPLLQGVLSMEGVVEV